MQVKKDILEPAGKTQDCFPGATGKSQNTNSGALQEDYFRLRDFEYAQPLYDLAYLLETEALAKGTEVPKFRTFSLWRAAYSLDGYSISIDKWLTGEAGDDSLDYVPSARIRTYLTDIRDSGTIPELDRYSSPEFQRALRLRAIKGLGFSQAAKSISEGDIPSEQWLSSTTAATHLSQPELIKVYQGVFGTWQAAHIVPPLVRFLKGIEAEDPRNGICSVDKGIDGIAPISQMFGVEVFGDEIRPAVNRVLKKQPLFKAKFEDTEGFVIQHQMGWSFRLRVADRKPLLDLTKWAGAVDPFLEQPHKLKADLHLHTAWSDGNASLESMAATVKKNGLSYFAVTDHSRSCKVQGGLTPVLWLRQAASIALNRLTCPILHGIEVDILEDGTLDLPPGLLAGMDIVVGSVHSNWSSDEHTNTRRLIHAIESGLVDIIGHPTSAVIGKPGVPDYVRAQAKINWEHIFHCCAKWSVALELNCFPSRLDLPLKMLRQAIDTGCWISFGSDAHSRTHLNHLRFGHRILNDLRSDKVLNLLGFEELKEWLRNARNHRNQLPKTALQSSQPDLFGEMRAPRSIPKIKAYLSRPQRIPKGSKIVGFDLTAGKNKPTGVALLNGMEVSTCSLGTDQELLDFVVQNKPAIVSIDSPLGFPGGGHEIDPSVGIVRVAEHDLSSVGIPAYPALIDSMKELTTRGVRLRKSLEGFENPPTVIESYPGAAQDVLCIPRKQKGLDLLRSGLRELGLTGPGLQTDSHDEMDAITSAIVGRFYEVGDYMPMGIPAEAQLIVPRIRPLEFEKAPIICLAGKTGSGKSVIARYLALFYGFRWIRTRDLIRQLLIEDSEAIKSKRLYSKGVTPETISDQHLREFGLVVLEKCRQEPIRRMLQTLVDGHNEPMVIDSVRDLTDFDISVQRRPTYSWFVECSDSIITNRLIDKSKIPSFKGRPTVNPIDQKVSSLRDRSDCVIGNTGTLEDLRWKIDDALFEVLHFSNSDFVPRPGF